MSVSKIIQIGAYEINPRNKLGKGSFGVVYKGKHAETKREVAIKRIELEHEDEDKANIFTEIKSMDHLQGHVNVVQLLDAIIKELDCWIVMELCELGDLQTYLKKHKHKLTLDEKIDFMYQAVSPIAFMHQQNPPIIHRDIKPGNYLLTQGHHKDEIILKVTDFGLAKLYDRENALDTVNHMSATMCGTLHYMAPEFWTESTLKYDFSVDTYALGLTLYVILEAREGSNDLPYTINARRDGIVSYPGNEMQTAYKKRKPIPSIVDIHESDSTGVRTIKQLIEQMTAFNPQERWPLTNVVEELQDMIVHSKNKHQQYLPPVMKMERELTNLSLESGPDSGIVEQEGSTADEPPDSVAYAMMRSVTPLDETTDSAYHTQAQQIVKMSLVDQLRQCLESGSSYGSVFTHGVGSADIKCGDVVRIESDLKKLKSTQQNCGLWEDDMKECIGLCGWVTGIEDNKARVRCINNRRYVLSTQILHKETLDMNNMTGGDYVVVKPDAAYVKDIQTDKVGWVNAMERQIGKAGIVRCVKRNRVKVEHSGRDNFVWCKEALILVAKGDEIMKVLLQGL